MAEVTATSTGADSQPVKKNTVQAEKQITFWDRIVELQQLVAERRYGDVVDKLSFMLNVLERGTNSFGSHITDTGPLTEKQATIFCSAVTRLLSDPDFKIGDAQFLSLAALKRPLAQAFEISGYRGTDHFLLSFGRKDGEGRTTFNRQELVKLFLGLSVNALSPQLVDVLLRQPPDLSWPLCIGFLSEQIVWSGHGKAARSRILAAKEHLSKTSPKLSMIRNLGPAYMGCSYDESVHKHEIKDAMNAVMRGYLAGLGVEDVALPTPRRPVKRRPTVLIIAELYDSRHAMHRCYGPSIASLKSRFKTIVMTPSGKMDEALTGMFDKVDTTTFDANNPKPFIDKAISYRPDIVYYPSVGMRLVSIVCSNVRIAPIQIFTPGHPATTRSEKMDYIFLMEGCFGESRCYSEKVILRKNQPYFEMRSDADAVVPDIAQNPSVVRIAVPAWSRKVTPGFLKVCQHIETEAKKAGREVEFWFFPNGVGSLFQAFGRRVKSLVNAVVLPRTNYNNYVTQLNKCDMFLSTFPFGATNSIVDAVIQGLPVVNLDGDEAHAKNDSDMLRTIDQPDWLSAKNMDDYVKAALRLILSDSLRVEISENILACNPADHFLVAKDKQIDDFAELFALLYEKHEAINTSGRPAWKHDELTAL